MCKALITGAVTATGLVAALVKEGLVTAAYARSVFLWILKPGEREAIRGMTGQG
jgi:hypothetical protein